MIEKEGKKSLATELRHRVDIQERVSVTDGEGGFVATWETTISNTPAAIYPIQAKQVWAYRAINVTATHLLKMRGYTQISENSRIVFKGRIFEILTEENIQEQDYVLILTCKELR